MQVTRRSDKEQNRFGSTWSRYRRGRSTCFKRLREASTGLREASTEFHHRRVFHQDVLTVTGQSRYIIRSLVSKCYTYIVLLILLLSIIMPIYSRYTKKKLIYKFNRLSVTGLSRYSKDVSVKHSTMVEFC